MEINEEQINTERWWYNYTSRLYFLSTENDPREECRGSLVAGNFTRTMFTQFRRGVPFKPRLDEGVYLSFGKSQDGWEVNEMVLFDPTSKVYQIDSRQYKHSEEGMRFQDLDDSVATHILYHKERFYTAPNMKAEELDPLFKILGELQQAKKGRNRGMWWL